VLFKPALALADALDPTTHQPILDPITKKPVRTITTSGTTPTAVDKNGKPVAIGDLFKIDFSKNSLFDNLFLAVDGIDLFLGGLQDTLDGEVFGVKLPLIG